MLQSVALCTHHVIWLHDYGITCQKQNCCTRGYMQSSFVKTLLPNCAPEWWLQASCPCTTWRNSIRGRLHRKVEDFCQTGRCNNNLLPQFHLYTFLNAIQLSNHIRPPKSTEINLLNRNPEISTTQQGETQDFWLLAEKSYKACK